MSKSKSRGHLRSSRRVPPLKDCEIDHEIGLVDHSIPAQEPRSQSTETRDSCDLSTTLQPLVSSGSGDSLTQPPEENVRESNDSATEAGPSNGPEASQPPTKSPPSLNKGKDSISTQNGLSLTCSANKRLSQRQRHLPKEPETEIDILYENQRGGFLCGIPLFSSAALGNLDPPPWTNFAHKPSPTDITTAQVPDPSWEWAWSEWRINRDEAIQTDEDGWEYSFMFSKKFSWHGPKWYNSFVRRRAWIRRRIKKRIGYEANDVHLMNTEYFSVTPSKKPQRKAALTVEEIERASLSQKSRVSQEPGQASDDVFGKSREAMADDQEDVHAQVEIKTAEDLMPFLRRSRIDREKLESVENYIKNCTDDLSQLQDYMHEIMSIFVFQASRRLLLTRLIQLHDDVVEEQKRGKSAETQKRADNLVEAIKHADEEVRRLEYWSDIKGMAESGESGGAVDCNKGWDSSWKGLDGSGATTVQGKEEFP
ncbi:hypothetical protein F4775DRAFT_408121 [Biscogniauxia sp. FL1348]|nr:hypothetical protein F4775DRAFT_408121 [Biscogniauxia sp. FL1348]